MSSDHGTLRTMRSLAAFGGVGALAYLVDVGVYNLLRSTVLTGSPIWSKVASVAVATAVAWVGNRQLAFRDGRRDRVGAEAALFVAINGVGLLVAAGALAVSHYVLGLTSQLADNVAGNVVGTGLGTVVRFLGYRYLVFPVGRPSRTQRPATPRGSAVPATLTAGGAR